LDSYGRLAVSHPPVPDEYATLRDQWVRSVYFPVSAAYTLFTSRPRLISEGQAFILVYSIADRSSFNCLKSFRQSMMRVTRQHPIFMLVGNQSDKKLHREVSGREGAALAKKFGCEFLETSAKTKDNIDLLFINLIRTLRKARPPMYPTPTPRRERSRKCYIL
jgi:GTPase KRas protein